MNNTNLAAAEKWLNELGIKTTTLINTSNLLLINRKDMEDLGGVDMIIAELRKGLNNNKFYWDGKCDVYMHLSTF